PDGKTFPGHTVNISLSGSGAVQCHVSDDNVFRRFKHRQPVRCDHQGGTGLPFTKIIIGFSFQVKNQTAGGERTKTLTGTSPEPILNRTLWQSLATIPFGDLVTEHSSSRPVRIADGKFACDFFPMVQGWFRMADQPTVQHLINLMILLLGFEQ